MKKVSIFGILIGLLLLFLAGCSKGVMDDNIDLKYGNTIALNGVVYGFTGEYVSAEKVDKQIGEAQRVVSPKVE